MAGIAICILETGYMVFIWPRKTRLLWLTCMLLVHLGIAILMGLYLFSFIMIVLNVAAFGVGVIRLSAPFRRPVPAANPAPYRHRGKRLAVRTRI